MTATRAASGEEHVIHFPYSTVEEDRRPSRTCTVIFWFCLISGAVSLAVGLCLLDSWLDQPVEYSASIVSVDDGLGAAGSRRVSVAGGGSGSLAVPALFNLAVRVTNPSRVRRECVYSDSTAAVWYNGTRIAEGDVPPFCAEEKGELAFVVPLRGVLVDAPLTWLPPPGEMQSTGAVVHVKMQLTKRYRDLPTRCPSLKVGGGVSRCS